MSVQLILGNDDKIDVGFIPNEGLASQWSEFSAISDVAIPSNSLTIQGHTLSNVDNKLNVGGASGILSATQVEAPIGLFTQTTTETLMPLDGAGGAIEVSGDLNAGTYGYYADGASDLGNLSVGKLTSRVYGAGSVNQVLSLDANGDVKFVDNDGDGANWSQYQATQAVDMNSQTLANLNKLTLTGGDEGLSGQVLGLDASKNLVWLNDSSGDVSQWATYTASQNVNMGNHDITNVHDLTGASSIGSNVAYFNKISPVTYGQGTSGQYLSLDQNLQIKWNTLPTSTPSTWANYPATASINMSGLDITNMGSLICNGTLQANQATPTSGTFTINGVGKAGNFENIYSGNENKLYILKTDTIRTITNGNGTADQLLSQDAQNKLKWVDAPTASNWSSYVASSDIDANSNGLTNLKSLTLDGAVAGTEDQVLSVDASGNLKWKDDASGDVSQWATYTASQNVDMGNFEVQNASKVVATEVDVNEYTIVQGNSTTEPALKSLIINPPENYGYVSIGNSTNAGNVEIIGDGSFTAPNGGMRASYLTSWNVANSLDQNFMDSYGLTIKDTATATNDIFRLDAETSVARLPYINRDQNSLNVYVVNNTNLSGVQNGTIEAPFNSIKLAVDWVNANGNPSSTYTINIDNGSYSDTFSITHPNINFVGSSPNIYGATKTAILGLVAINVAGASGNLHGHQISFNNIQLTKTIYNYCSADVCINFKNCYFYVFDGAYDDTNITATDARVRFLDCFMKSTDALNPVDALIKMKVGMLAMNYTQLETAGNIPCLSLTGSAVVDVINMCKFTSNHSASTNPLVSITSTASGTYSFANCGFVYSNASTNACCAISNNNASGSNNIFVLYNSFYLVGLDGTAGNYCVKNTGGLVFYFSNNALVGTTSAIEGTLGVNKFSMLAVA